MRLDGFSKHNLAIQMFRVLLKARVWLYPQMGTPLFLEDRLRTVKLELCGQPLW